MLAGRTRDLSGMGGGRGLGVGTAWAWLPRVVTLVITALENSDPLSAYQGLGLG